MGRPRGGKEQRLEPVKSGISELEMKGEAEESKSS
jgi:hypothetical protein